MPNKAASLTQYAPAIEERRSGIFFPTVAALRQGLEVLLGKRPPGTQNAYVNECKTASPNLDLGLIMMDALRPAGAEGRFLDSLFEDIEGTFAKWHVFTQNIDYAGIGPFYMSSVTVWKLPDGGIIYQMCAAGTLSEQIEGPLVKSLVTERCLASVVTTIRGCSDGSRFSFDFGDICTKVNKALGLALDASAVVATLMQEADDDYAPPKMILADLGEGLELRCAMRDTGYTHLKDEARSLAYKANDTVITGPLGTDYTEQEPSGFAIPLVDLLVCTAGDPYNTWILDPVGQAKAREIAEKLKLAFSEP